MSWFSLLPPYLTVVETWIIRIFLLLALLTLGPWFLFLLYDLLLYLLRAISYEVPIIGGRARGKRRPRRPTFGERAGAPPAVFQGRPAEMVRGVVEEVGEWVEGHVGGEGEGMQGSREEGKSGGDRSVNGGAEKRRGYVEVTGDG